MPSKKQVIKTYVSKEEYDQISATAKQCSLSMSAFMKAVCLGHEIKSRTDQQARLELLKLNADQGRLGGLLKMWILDDDEHRTDVEALLEDLRRLQRKIIEKVRSI
ncbi:plasmid mobilization protein [Maridesulfovibrio hydrothermalis]|uniref:TraJ protein n=1 Tax=Maridesulfovibrio hydrothermalis AM13 = DSM 14728 TaxID=1121451 RepID=L0RB91_9BACT|nr:TraJ protein [Maridesulfovibrio hydrothermalis]CCO24053.1 TraJ protein [Maridesulfovibrio hydrothermalis AM13 = DSM 14728]